MNPQPRQFNPMIYPGLSEYGQSIFKKRLRPCTIGTPDDVINNICAVFGVEKYDLWSSSRTADLTMYRQIAMFDIKANKPSITLKGLGRIFNRDHTTVIYSIKQYEDRIIYDKGFKHAVEEYRAYANYGNKHL